MKDNDCDLCQRKNITCGRDKFLQENKFGIIVLTGNLETIINGKRYKVKKRISLVLHDHIKKLKHKEEGKIKNLLEKYLYEEFGFKRKKDYDFFITMTTYTDHWHIHACFYPFKTLKNKT